LQSVSEKTNPLNSCLSIIYVFQIELKFERLKETTTKIYINFYKSFVNFFIKFFRKGRGLYIKNIVFKIFYLKHYIMYRMEFHQSENEIQGSIRKCKAF
jgi:hypothetical protein